MVAYTASRHLPWADDTLHYWITNSYIISDAEVRNCQTNERPKSNKWPATHTNLKDFQSSSYFNFIFLFYMSILPAVENLLFGKSAS